MNLCNKCEGLDIRALLLKSEAQKPEPTGALSRTQIDPTDFRLAIPHSFKHLDSIVALKHSSEAGCSLCVLFWSTWIKTLNKPDFTEEWLDRTFEGQLYLGSSSWTTSGQGFPYITLSQLSSTGASRTLGSFEPFADRDDLPEDGRNLVGRSVYEDSSSPGCILLASEWLHECLDKHKCGPLQDMAPLPTRVIDVGDENQHPKLVTTGGKLDQYIALSYCWGGDSIFIFNDSTKEALESGIPIQDFPQTLQDAVLITRRLGIPYVWIDALCIKQDSAEDWAREAAKMKEVYADAVLTVIASNSPSTRSGIFSKRENGLKGVLEFRGLNQTSKLYLRSGSDLWDHSLQTSPLAGRGWTLQEGLLAPRTLSYGHQQMIWECSQFQSDEGGRTTKATENYRSKGFLQELIRIGEKNKLERRHSLFDRLSLRFMKPDEWWKSYSIANPYDRWYDICEQFTGRSLTKDFDVLPALSGLASVFQHVLNDTYCAGLWKKEIMCSLMWARSPRYPSDLSTRFELSKKSEYLAPSWTWASMLGKTSSVSLNWKTRNAFQQSSNATIAEIISVGTITAGPDPFGKVSSGELTIRGRYRKLEYMPSIYSKDNQWPNETPDWGTTSLFEKHLYSLIQQVDRIVYERYQQHEACSSQEFGVFELIRWRNSPGSHMPGIQMLILESTGNREGEYRRIGQTGVTKSPVPIREDVTDAMYFGIIEENDAYDAAIGENWSKRTITIV